MLVEVGPDTANCDGEIETPLMFRVTVPVFVIFTACEELLVFVATEPNASEVGVTVPWADPGVELPTVSVKEADPKVPLLAHARMST
jgi:hypothetical protein